uniref:HSF-type DNA-binding domain-containing protein n=1 Tax=Catharus ustulatus TaxID=91951 RepID=A0A8C3UVB7_CATUS
RGPRAGPSAAPPSGRAPTFPAKLWHLVNSPRVRSVRWDSRGQGLLIDRSLFERELLRPGSAQGPAPHTFRATQFPSFVRQLYRYGFRKVPGCLGSAVPGEAEAGAVFGDGLELQLSVRLRNSVFVLGIPFLFPLPRLFWSVAKAF